MPIPYPTFCTKISPSGNLQRYKSGCGANIRNIMQKKRDKLFLYPFCVVFFYAQSIHRQEMGSFLSLVTGF